MKHISEILLEITQRQVQFQRQQNELYDMLKSLSGSSNINTIASLPKLDADLCALNVLHGRINRSVQAVNHPR